MSFASDLRILTGAALWVMAVPAFAQSAPAEQAAADAAAATEDDGLITITGSRIKGNFEAPTPVLAIGTELIDQRGTTNIANVLNEIPAFTGTLTPASTNLNSR